MNAMKAVSSHSIRSKRTAGGERGATVTYERDYEHLSDFEISFPDVCRRYGLVQQVIVRKQYINEEFFKELQLTSVKKNKASRYQSRTTVNNDGTNTEATTVNPINATVFVTADLDYKEEDFIKISAMYDAANRFVELSLHKLIETPRELIIIIGFVARYYINLKKIKIQYCKIDQYTIYEVSKLICISAITEVDLDGSATVAGNYGLLFDNTNITNVSLSKCNINDTICEVIASKLCIAGPAEKSLSCLNLSSNQIKDKGAKHLSNALRSNRTLRYLNLADNQITDEGAGNLLDSLQEFRLTDEEKLAKSIRRIAHEKKRLVYYYKYLNEFVMRNIDNETKTLVDNKRKGVGTPKMNKLGGSVRRDTKEINKVPKAHTAEDYETRAEVLAGEVVGSLRDPFQINCLKEKEGQYYSGGNMVLCYLNLSYNNLSYLSVVKLLKVLQYQKDTKRSGEIGLMRVILLGNDLPVYCDEYVRADELLTQCMIGNGGKSFTNSFRRKSKISTSSMMTKPSGQK